MDQQLVPATVASTLHIATRAESDVQLVDSWIDGMRSPHSRRNFQRTATEFLAALCRQLRGATVEDIRCALDEITAGHAETTAHQYVNRVKSLLTYGHQLGYLPFNPGVAIKLGGQRATLSKRILDAAEVGMLIRAASTPRDAVMISVGYAGALRVSEIVGLKWSDVIRRDADRVQLSVLGKGGKIRQVVLPAIVSCQLMMSRHDAPDDAPVFPSRKGGHLLPRGVHALVKRAAKRAGINPGTSPHWLRHSHASHALERGSTIAEVQTTLGHASASTTSVYFHARPDRSSGLVLDTGVFRK